ncbi:uncharacterized protein SCHCODRAFT_02210069 [Schizophyllum commune H4-8]|uniref:uncharacterized protein n=1 Tax=Schizophyllum commune (strain H4-8 / FGSC 9210) TaxID=578458 RepID=UPI00215E33B5|nr:uncharacterized protein SCHCODRAFT_02210069 [Schizophyllum commune H4-8]KAI5894480.1 hypothetical protein SCHCODRAFT_02210069 [Schizophyllum commune H4-8]
MCHIHARNAQLEYESKFTLDLPNCSTLWRPHTLDVNSAIRHAIRHSPLGYLTFPHSDPPNLDRALHATERIDPATALPFEIVSKIFVHVYGAAPLLRRSDQIAHTVACVNPQWRDIALASPALWATISVGNWTGRTGDYTALALARSKGTPITVACISQSDSVFEEFMGLVLPHIARWRTAILLYP